MDTLGRLNSLHFSGQEFVVVRRALIIVLTVANDGSVALGNQGFSNISVKIVRSDNACLERIFTKYLHSANKNGAASLLWIVGASRLDIIDGHVSTLSNELLAQKFASLVHPRDIVQWPKSLLLVLSCLLFSKPDGEKIAIKG